MRPSLTCKSNFCRSGSFSCPPDAWPVNESYKNSEVKARRSVWNPLPFCPTSSPELHLPPRSLPFSASTTLPGSTVPPRSYVRARKWVIFGICLVDRCRKRETACCCTNILGQVFPTCWVIHISSRGCGATSRRRKRKPLGRNGVGLRSEVDSVSVSYQSGFRVSYR